MSSASGSGDGSPNLSQAIGLDAEALARMLAFFDLGPADAAALRAIRPLAEASVGEVVERFYDHLLRFPELRELLEREPGRIERLKALQRGYFVSLTDGRIDAEYAESRLRVGNAHQRIDLQPEWYIGAFALYTRLALRTIVAESGEGDRILPTIEALVKTIGFDMALAMRTYIFGGYVAREVADQLRRASELAAETLAARADVERLKDELAAMIVHDLKNPVNGILMMVQLALRKSAGLSEAHQGYYRQIEITCREMMRLIQNLLEISKIEAGEMPITREPVLLAELVDEVVAEHHLVAQQAGHPLHVDVPVELPPVVADRALLRRVLANLIANAIRHSGSRSIWIEGSVTDGDGTVTLSVRDQGRGIPPELHERVFEKFAALPRSAAEEPFRDTGLGLPFCKLAVERMGGRIELASAPGAGATFTVTLPVHRA